MIDVFKNYRVLIFGHNNQNSGSQDYQVLKNLVGSKGVESIYLYQGKVLRSDLIQLDVVWPMKDTNLSKTNDEGVVTLLKYRQFKAIFMADVENNVSDQIAGLNQMELVNYIKVNHHGSKNGISEKLIQVLKPKIAVISVAAKNSYGHPHQEVIDLLKRVDEKEEQWLIRYDEVGNTSNLVGISRLSAYAKLMRTISNSVIYESIYRANYEYRHLQGNEKLKKEPRTYLYILFQILNVTLAVSGAITREDKGLNRKGTVMNFPTSYQSLMGNAGQNLIKRGYEIIPLNFGEEPNDKDKYSNLISEAWFYFKEIINEIQLPNDRDLLMELSTRLWKQDIKGRRCIESKNDYKKRGYRSPDLADACIICYYNPRNIEPNIRFI